MQPSAQQRLCEAFLFDSLDLAANRSGRLSERQEARLRAASGGARLAFATFALLTCGSAGGAAWMAASASGAGLAAAALAAAVVLAVGYFASRDSLAALRGRKLAVAEGAAEPAGTDRLRIGRFLLRLAAPELLEAFDPGAAYRVFYLPGPRALVLSAEPLGAGPPVVSESASPAAALAADPVLRRVRRARGIVLALAALAVLTPLAGWAAAHLAPGPRALAVLALTAGGLAFALVAAWQLRRR